jgi:hypothetical protein
MLQSAGHLSYQFDLELLYHDPGAIGHLHHGVKGRHNSRCIDKRLRPERRSDRVSRMSQPLLVVAERGLHKFFQQLALGNATFYGAIDDALEVELRTSMIAARTEQGRMAGRSIVAAID